MSPGCRPHLGRSVSPLTAWRIEARSRVDTLGARLRHQDPAEPASAWRSDVQARLDVVRRDLEDGRWRLWHLLTGDAPADVWTRLHEIEDELNDFCTDLALLTQQAELHLANEPSARKRATATEELTRLTGDPALVRARLLVRESHARSRRTHDTERSTQRGAVVISLVLLAMALVTWVVQIRSTTYFVPAPGDSTIGPATLLVLLMGSGALGALLSALTHLYLGSRRVSDTTWFDPRPGLTCAKVGLGVWAAVLGSMAVGSELLVGEYSSVPAAIMLATAFGYSQQALTKFLDQKASGLVDTGAGERPT